MNSARLLSFARATVRSWLVIAIALFFVLALVAQPAAWAASVPESGNQTVPPGDERMYFPLIRLAN